jgi:hypothetical protein
MRKIMLNKKTLPTAVLAVIFCCGLIFTGCGRLEDVRNTYTVTFTAGYTTNEKKVDTWEYEGETYVYEYEVPVYVELLSVKRQTNTLGKLSSFPTVPERPDDYNFDGWYTTGGTLVTIETVFLFDTGVVARWRMGETIEIEEGLVSKRFTEIRNALAGGQPLSEYTVEVTKDETILPQTLEHNGATEVTIILKGISRTVGGVSVLPIITLDGGGSLFAVGRNVTLELRNIWLAGVPRNNRSVLAVNAGGTLIIGENASDKTSIYQNGSEDEKWGGGVTVNEGGYLEMRGGEIYGTAVYATQGYYDPFAYPGGGGVFVRGGTFLMTGGTIQLCYGAINAGGVMVDKGGRFKMTGGKLFENVSPYGGGVMVYRGGLFEMEDGAEIQRNTALYGAGVFVERGNFDNESANPYDPTWPDNVKGTPGYDPSKPENDPKKKEGFYMSGGLIYENGAESQGGGLVNSSGGVAYMTGGIIRGNMASSGGGVANYGLFYMMDGTIEANTGNYGSGLVTMGGFFIMEDGKITGNIAEVYGGGVYVNDQFAMHGGEISNNIARSYCGGVFITPNANSFAMSGGIITGNYTSNADRTDSGTLHFGTDALDPSLRGMAYYGKRPPGARRGNSAIFPIGEPGIDKDGAQTFIIKSYLVDYEPPNANRVELPKPWPNRTTIELKAGVFKITAENGDIIREVDIN